ncbi:hypothetical protein [Emticicia sp. BO119]|uniref:hypothetical protein n=1 Tax=Emticicia sp. BO119 TaxID=2757768 RepID=UPI0015EFFE55|nr:hypothetical protein [Emticicia sp. BO119]MBA4849630.1 hypothetical protein [Emticicia sp. BO119]
MKKILLALILPTIAMFSCEEGSTSIKVEKNLSKSKELIYHFNTAGHINEVASISAKALIDELTDDKEFFTDDYTITRLTVESLEVTLLPKAGNTASGLNTTTALASYVTLDSEAMLLSDEPIGMGEGANELINSHLLIAGVERLNNFLKGAIGDEGLKTLFVQVTGNTVPTNAKAVADLKLKLNFNLEYWYCQESIIPLLVDIEEDGCKR